MNWFLIMSEEIFKTVKSVIRYLLGATLKFNLSLISLDTSKGKL